MTDLRRNRHGLLPVKATIRNRVLLTPAPENPFNLANAEVYRAWREQKLAQRPLIEDMVVAIDDPSALRLDELQQIKQLVRRCNMVVYKVSAQTRLGDKELVHRLGLQLGLAHLDDNLRSDEDDITSLTVTEQRGHQYIPYTNRPLSWHTDGYYNAPEQQVRAFILHCAQAAAEGGENSLIDHELVYLRIRDENPALIKALMHPEAMVIPPNVEQGSEVRGACAGPVFSVDQLTGSLHMRYTARKRNIQWRDDALTREAAHLITQILDIDEIAYTYRLGVGEGVISNNVLHRRSGFVDDESAKRLMYRARYYDRVADTGLNQHV